MPRSQPERLWLIGGGIVGALMVLIGYFFFISPQRSQTSDVNSQAATARQEAATLQAHINTLRAQNKQLAKYRVELAAAQRALPSTSGLSDFLRTLQSLGNSTQTTVQMLTVGPPTDVSVVAANTPTGTTAPSTPAPSPSAAAPGATSGTPVTGGVYGLSISTSISGTAAALNNFLAQLQAVQPRAVLITQLTEGDTTTSGSGSKSGTTLQLTMQAFVDPTSPAEQANLAAASHK
ncbi:MAG: hypothetical protein QOH52_1595 [Pseudonocardiales bacterium]|jgi:hypothetical protein|nr:hypothetical protein [Pseudonocardiales bacterium]